MPYYIGFSTINANKPRSTNLPAGIAGGVGSMVQPVIPGKKYRLVDQQLVIQDLVNALNIRKGEKVGQRLEDSEKIEVIKMPFDKLYEMLGVFPICCPLICQRYVAPFTAAVVNVPCSGEQPSKLSALKETPGLSEICTVSEAESAH